MYYEKHQSCEMLTGFSMKTREIPGFLPGIRFSLIWNTLRNAALNRAGRETGGPLSNFPALASLETVKVWEGVQNPQTS